jgi:hypothetical protein
MSNYSYCIYSYYATLTSLDYNDYYYPNAPYIAYWMGNQYATLFAWKSGYPAMNMNSFNQNPDVKSATDLHLNTGSPGIR